MQWSLWSRQSGPARFQGFTLLELMLGTAIVAILGALSVASYHGYVIRGRTAQTLVNVDHIRTVLAVELATGAPADLAAGAVAGRAPPGFAGSLSDWEFSGVFEHTLWFFKAPAGTFASFPDRAVYALLAVAGNSRQQQALYALRWGLPFQDGDMPWLSAQGFAFPLESPTGGAGAAPNPDPDPSLPPDCARGSRFGQVEVQGVCGGAWSAQAVLAACNSEHQPLTAVSGQVQILRTETVRAWNGELVQYAWTTWGDWQDGFVAFREPALRPEVLSVSYDVLGVHYYYPTDPVLKWDGQMPSITLDSPCDP